MRSTSLGSDAGEGGWGGTEDKDSKLKDPGVQGEGCAVYAGIDSLGNDDHRVAERKSANLQYAQGSSQEDRKELQPEGASRAGPAAAAAAKSLQSCPTLCDPIDGSPPGSPVPGILQARTLEWVAISFSNA